MTPRDNRYWECVIFALSLVAAAVFIYAGIDKLRDPLQFADSIAGFDILPRALINLFALLLPSFEVVCGLLLLWPWTRRIASLGVFVIS
jgi:putative oxidoreductase